MNKKLSLSLLSQLMVLLAVLVWAGVCFGGKLPFVTIGTGNTTGVYYSAGHAVAKVYNPGAAEHGFRLDAEASNGSVDNINKVLDGTWEFGIAQADMLFKAQEGWHPWEGIPQKNLRAVAGLYTEAVLFVTREDQDIRKLADLRGKKLNIGAPGSSDNENALLILDAAGLKPKTDLTIKEERTVDASELLEKGDIDAYIYTVGHPNLSIREAAVSGRKIRLVPVDPPLVEEYTRKRAFLTKTRVNTAFYPGLEEQGDIYTIGVKAILFTRADTPDATVMESPPVYEAKLPKKIPTKVFKVYPFPQREIPEVFWYQDGLPCSLVRQKKQAPLVFIIAGTGARYNSPKMVTMQKALYQAGFHVISISSPTYLDFVVNASSTMVPGHLVEDAKDLYRVMELAWPKVQGDIDVSSFHLTGYSLGGIHSAFVSKLDEDKKVFNFKRVLLINPPVNLFNSVSILDQMLVENVPGGLDNFNEFIQEVMDKFAEVSEKLGYVEFSSDYLYRVYKKYPPREDHLATLIGFSFRMSSSSLIFAADVMNGGGYVVPTNVGMSNSTSLTPFTMVLFRTAFTDYFHEYFYPYFREREPGLGEQELIDRLSLKSIESYLLDTEKIGLMTNEDEIILAPGEIEYLRNVFGKRARIYPTGGHCGNMNHPVNVVDMVKFFKREG